MNHQFKENDILVSRSGYEETHYDFYIIIGVFKSKIRLAQLKKICGTIDSGLTSKVTFDIESTIGIVFDRKPFTTDDEKFYVKIKDREYASLIDNRKYYIETHYG